MRPSKTTVTGVTTSPWLPVDAYTAGGAGFGVFVEPGAGATVSVEMTPDDVFDPAVTPVAYATGVAALSGAVANAQGMVGTPVKAFRLNQTVGATLSTLKVVNRGLS
jgi:hypothetical protein